MFGENYAKAEGAQWKEVKNENLHWRNSMEKENAKNIVFDTAL